MVSEFAILQIKMGASAAFETAFESVAALLVGADGYRRHRLVAVLDQPDLYLLEVEWRDLSAHVERFEPSAAHTCFMASLEPLLRNEPYVIHVPVSGEGSA